MNFTLESVQFRIPGGANGAFNVSVRDNQGVRRIVTGPEWLNGVRQPAALAGHAPARFIDVVLRCSDPGAIQAQVQAAAVAGHVLGDIAPLNIPFQNGLGAGRIQLTAAHIGAVGKQEIQWHWQVTAGPNSSAFDSAHTIYTVLDTPKLPWETNGNDPSAAPWEEALDASCQWASGAATGPDVLTGIAQHHFHSGKFKYGSETYAEEAFFKMKMFFDHQAQSGAVFDVNCADCASIVRIFGGLLGAACVDVQIHTETGGYILAQTDVFVGGESAACQPFVFHEVVWDVPSEDTAIVWDFCLGYRHVKGNAANRPAEPFTAIRFRNPSARATYAALSGTPATASHLELKQLNDQRNISDTSRILDLGLAVVQLTDWSGRYRDYKGLVFQNFVPGRLGDLAPVETYRYENRPRPWLVDNLYRYDGERLQVSVFECDSREEAHLALAHLLADRRIDPVLVLSTEPIGDVLFYDDAKVSDLLLFGRGNLAVRLQRSRGSRRSLLEYAQLIDSLLTLGLAEIRQAASNNDEVLRETFHAEVPDAGPWARHSCDTAALAISWPSGKVSKLP